jgi:hypothetical protein
MSSRCRQTDLVGSFQTAPWAGGLKTIANAISLAGLLRALRAKRQREKNGAMTASLRPPPPLTDRIAIAGAGASGIAAAHYLRNNGYQNVVIFERRDRIGGKCDTEKIDSLPYDLGATFVGSSYSEVGSLAKDFGIQFEPTLSNTVFMDNEEGTFRTRSLTETIRNRLAVTAYIIKIGSGRYESLFQPGFKKLDSSLIVPFGDWIRLNSPMPSALRSFFNYTFTPFGYGYMEEVPACYAIKYYEKEFVSSLMKTGQAKHVSGGFQSLWERIAQGMEIQLSAEITQIQRRNDLVYLEAKGQVPKSFHHLILTCPLDQAANLMDCDDQEWNILSKVKYYFYHSLLVEVPADFPAALGYFPVNFHREKAGHPLCWFWRFPQKNLALFYAFSEKDSDLDSVVVSIYRDSDLYSWKLGRIVTARSWRYFPHFSTSDLKNGIYDVLENLQGSRRVYFAGEIMNFSTVEMVTRYSKALVERFFSR